MSEDKSQRYNRIARACLKAINETADSPEARERNIQNVYQAIDKAFQAELQAVHQDQLHLIKALKRIADGTLDAQAQQRLAKETLAHSAADPDKALH